MNVKLSYDVNFSVVVFDGNSFAPNSYSVKINIITATENSTHQNVAIQRILFFLKEIMHGSIFVNGGNTNLAKLMKLAKNNRIAVFPEDPYDQIVGLMLLHKLSAITEGKFEIDSLFIGSLKEPELKYIVEEYELFDHDDNIVPWWERPDLTMSENSKQNKMVGTWADLDLDWESNKDKQNNLEFILELEDNDIKPEVIIIQGGEPEKEIPDEN